MAMAIIEAPQSAQRHKLVGSMKLTNLRTARSCLGFFVLVAVKFSNFQLDVNSTVQ